MCCRYYISKATEEEILQVVRQVDQKLNGHQEGDVNPSMMANVICGKDALFTEKMGWGFPKPEVLGSGLIINARVETAAQKPMFRDSLMNRRCIIPATGYYEWDCNKQKASFFREDKKPIYMAGFYKYFDEHNRFVILTTNANESVMKVHDRMPLILERNEMEDWIFEDKSVPSLLAKKPIELCRFQEYEQQSLFDVL